jgi:hypothetical protein
MSERRRARTPRRALHARARAARAPAHRARVAAHRPLSHGGGRCTSGAAHRASPRAARHCVRRAQCAPRAARRKLASLRARERASCTPSRGGGGIIAIIAAMTGVSSRSYASIYKNGLQSSKINSQAQKLKKSGNQAPDPHYFFKYSLQNLLDSI